MNSQHLGDFYYLRNLYIQTTTTIKTAEIIFCTFLTYYFLCQVKKVINSLKKKKNNKKKTMKHETPSQFKACE